MKELVLRGTPRQRGLIHGESMKSEIHAALEFYQERFAAKEINIEHHLSQLMSRVAAFRPDFITEMDGIAQAANIEPFWIYAINCRSELISSPIECSSTAFPAAKLIGQNWDWAEPLEGLLTLADIELESGHRFLTMVEPGMLAKVGLNCVGIGTCLNILPANRKLNSLPVHILLRAILESQSLTEARQLIEQHGSNKASHIIVGSPEEVMAVELTPEQPLFMDTSTDCYLHTNHYLSSGQAQNPATRDCSVTRLERMQQLLANKSDYTLASLQALLNNNEEPYPILRPYSFNAVIGDSGTLISLIMDLPNKTLYLREGFDPNVFFQTYCVSK